ncbi:uncharacterized protein LOC106179294 [Lingula anatina]|uniref:Uncharacterized protein LOC106179294 n=1 Tax=Lingula anatina TaxID=7574 RepID=A0A1S3K6P2_LINAN|nr:uncharacterized protein LOC106179294 [Lingula anatina]|eukprot:XP_013418303.1 uncharacterized protein LOC106179294 [Lingula anatina]
MFFGGATFAISCWWIGFFPASLPNLERLQTCMQNALGSSPQVQLEPFINWATIVRRDHVLVIKPTTNAEVRKVIRAAIRFNRKIRVAGASALSWSELFPDEGQILLDLALLTLEGGQRAIFNPPAAERPYSTVTVAGGVRQDELDLFLLNVGHAMASGPQPKGVTIAGAIGTASHGGSYTEPSIGGYLESVRVYDARGRQKYFTASANPAVLRAMRSHLGLLGVIVEVEMKVEPLQMVSMFTAFVPLAQMLNATFVNQIVTSNYYVEARWATYNSLTEEEVQQTNASGKVPTSWTSAADLVWLSFINPNGTAPDLDLDFNVTYDLNVTSISFGQNIFAFLATEGFIADPIVLPKPFAIHPLNATNIPPVSAMEYTIPEMPQFLSTVTALQVVAASIEGASYANGILPLGIVEMRWIKGTDCTLCPGKADVCGFPSDSHYLTMEIQGLVQPTEAFEGYKVFANTVFTQLDQIGLEGMPHWAKMAESIPSLKSKLNNLANRQCTREFLRVRAEMDILGWRFSNRFLRRILPGNIFAGFFG